VQSFYSDEEKILLILSILNRISNFTMDFHVAKTIGELFSDNAQSRLYRPLSSCICKRRDEYAQYISSRHIHPNGDWSVAIRASVSNIGLHMHLTATASLSVRNVIRSHRDIWYRVKYRRSMYKFRDICAKPASWFHKENIVDRHNFSLPRNNEI